MSGLSAVIARVEDIQSRIVSLETPAAAPAVAGAEKSEATSAVSAATFAEALETATSAAAVTPATETATTTEASSADAVAALQTLFASTTSGADQSSTLSRIAELLR